MNYFHQDFNEFRLAESFTSLYIALFLCHKFSRECRDLSWFIFQDSQEKRDQKGNKHEAEKIFHAAVSKNTRETFFIISLRTKRKIKKEKNYVKENISRDARKKHRPNKVTRLGSSLKLEQKRDTNFWWARE